MLKPFWYQRDAQGWSVVSTHSNETVEVDGKPLMGLDIKAAAKIVAEMNAADDARGSQTGHNIQQG